MRTAPVGHEVSHACVCFGDVKAKGLAGREPGSPPAFVAMCAFICDSAEGYLAASQEHRGRHRQQLH